MKKIVFTAFLAGMFLLANAQKELPSWLGNVKFSGYALTQYQASFQKGNESNSFNIRMLRLALDGRIAGDFIGKPSCSSTAIRAISEAVREWWICLPNGRNMIISA